MHQLTYVTQEALFLVLVMSAPPVVMSLMVGFTIAVFQATTQINEQTLTFAPKLTLTLGVLGVSGAWLGAQISRFAFHVFDRFPEMIGR